MRRKAQVWIETVIYTLIGLALIALVLSFVMPKINRSQDKLLVEQSIDTLNAIDQKMQESMNGAAGSVRIIPALSLKKGSLIIDSEANEIKIVVDNLGYEYSESGVSVPYGRVNILTEKSQKNYKVTLKIAPEYDIQYDGQDSAHTFQPASTPYKISISNVNNVKVNIEETSGR